jgi:hypothetical protein
LNLGNFFRPAGLREHLKQFGGKMTAAPTVSAQLYTAPRAAAVAGVVFSVLMGVAFAIIRVAASVDPGHTGAWMTDPFWQNAVRFAINLVPFAGIAFLWFLGVLRNRLGVLEDRFFATVFLGSGLLFVASLFAAAAVAGSLVQVVIGGASHLANTETYEFVRRLTGALMNVFAVKMAGVFTFSTCTIALPTGFLPRWLAFAGYGCGLVMLLAVTAWPWIDLLFPLWIFTVSLLVLTTDLWRRDPAPLPAGNRK